MLCTVALPTRNSEWCLPYSLKALLNQVTQPNEYVICIGKSEDNTENLILEFQKQAKVPVKLCYDREGIGTGYAMSQILAMASGDIILWASSDGVKSKYWVSRMIKLFEDNKDISYLCNSGISKSPSLISKLDPEDIPYSENKKYLYNADSLAGILAFRRKDVIDVGGFDPIFMRGQDFDAVIRLTGSGKIGMNCGPQGYHFGIVGSKNLKKAIKTGTFFKFLYKYGWRYCLLAPHHFGGILLRTGFLFPTVMLIFTLFLNFNIAWIFGVLSLLSLLGLSIGIAISHGELTLNLLIFQMIESIGEYYQLLLFITRKDIPKMGYGKKWLK
jgi:glycosyltransferase involved in cell wall biosynthesis